MFIFDIVREMHFLFFFVFSATNTKYDHSSPWSHSAATGQPSSPPALKDSTCCCVPTSRVGHLDTSHTARESINAASKVTFPAHAHTGALAAHLQKLPQASLILSKTTFPWSLSCAGSLQGSSNTQPRVFAYAVVS